MHERLPSSASLTDMGKRYWLPVYRPRELVLDHGKGAHVWDTQGRDYVDFGAGIAVNALGHQYPDLLEALTAQAHKLWHASNVFYTEPPLRLAEELVLASGFAERVFLCNSGAEANEAAIKLVRKWAASNGRPPEQRTIITFRVRSTVARWRPSPPPHSRSIRKATSRCRPVSVTSISTMCRHWSWPSPRVTLPR